MYYNGNVFIAVLTYLLSPGTMNYTNKHFIIILCRCDGQRMCTMPVSSEVFGDPCPNTRKYVEVHFACSPKVRRTTTKRPLPPWFLQVFLYLKRYQIFLILLLSRLDSERLLNNTLKRLR